MRVVPRLFLILMVVMIVALSQLSPRLAVAADADSDRLPDWTMDELIGEHHLFGRGFALGPFSALAAEQMATADLQAAIGAVVQEIVLQTTTTADRSDHLRTALERLPILIADRATWRSTSGETVTAALATLPWRALIDLARQIGLTWDGVANRLQTSVRRQEFRRAALWRDRLRPHWPSEFPTTYTTHVWRRELGRAKFDSFEVLRESHSAAPQWELPGAREMVAGFAEFALNAPFGDQRRKSVLRIGASLHVPFTAHVSLFGDLTTLAVSESGAEPVRLTRVNTGLRLFLEPLRGVAIVLRSEFPLEPERRRVLNDVDAVLRLQGGMAAPFRLALQIGGGVGSTPFVCHAFQLGIPFLLHDVEALGTLRLWLDLTLEWRWAVASPLTADRYAMDVAVEIDAVLLALHWRFAGQLGDDFQVTVQFRL